MEAAAAESFIRDVEAGTTEVRDTDAQNRNEYKESKTGYGSKTRLKSRPTAAPISEDYTAK